MVAVCVCGLRYRDLSPGKKVSERASDFLAAARATDSLSRGDAGFILARARPEGGAVHAIAVGDYAGVGPSAVVLPPRDERVIDR
jgi:hypothetical protein